MLRGGDYNLGGLAGCGGQVTQALLKGDLGDSLMHVVNSATPVQLPSMLETWPSIPAEFPSIDVMHLYLHPVTPWSDTDESPAVPQFGPAQPDLMRLAKFCKVHLGWLPERVHKYLQENVWSAVCMRALCQLRVPTSDGSSLSKPSFRIDREMTHEGDAPAYKLTVYAPTFVMAASHGLQSDGDSRTLSVSQVDEECSWAPSEGKVIVPARIMQVTSPQEVIDFMDHGTNFSSQPEAGCSAPLPDWYPRLSVQYAARHSKICGRIKGETYRGLYHYEEATGVVTGNPALSATVQDMMEVLKNNEGAEGGSRNHASAMTIDDMRKLMTWSYRECPDEAVGRIFQGVRTGSMLDVAELVLAQRHLMLRAFSTTGFTIWTRNFELTKIKRKDVV
ncbi:hypothetical protein K503DRAFT_803109 [Rhizopogon vinicolor AM-OR11-026]|uniref:Uncharacterized protein n=1 Tax=Rhizopogon vinicolor AM-OR11-026 TaxID=1314800 RepID=A0A1B7MR34_9AGAM|nr:hypothetical protein K503DRAFT_803109 [Rhizopogon vinicolor AM-OR11-026]